LGERVSHRHGEEPGLGDQDRPGDDAGLVHGEAGQREVDRAVAQPRHPFRQLRFADLDLAVGMAFPEHFGDADQQLAARGSGEGDAQSPGETPAGLDRTGKCGGDLGPGRPQVLV
jgi:hypothetical protein